LAGLRQSRNFPSILHDFEKTRTRREVVIPQLMMNCLEVPPDLSCFDIEGDGGVAVQIVAWPVTTVCIRAGAAHGKINDAAILIGGEGERPNIIAGPISPTVESPGF